MPPHLLKILTLAAVGEFFEAISYALNARTERRILERLAENPDDWHTVRIGDCTFSRGDAEDAQRLTGDDWDDEEEEEEDEDDEDEDE